MVFLSILLSEWTILIGAIIFALYKFGTARYNFFEKKNISYARAFPFLGSFSAVLLQKQSFFDRIIEIVNEFKDKKFFGIFEGRNPMLAIIDPDIIKQVTIKDFDRFVNHRVFFTPEDAPLVGNSLFALRDQKWRDMRATLSPAFTGSKIRLMFELVEEVSRTALGYLKDEAAKKSSLEVDMKDLYTRFTNDVIASAAFGLQTNSLLEKDNEFYKMGRKATDFTGLASLKFFLFSNFAPVMRFFKIRLFDEKIDTFFTRLVLDTMKHRSEHGIVRPDMIHLLMEARKGALKHEEKDYKEDKGFATVEESSVGLTSSNRNWSDVDIVSQCFLFFFAGFETTSVLMCFCAQELMENPNIQSKLIEEIDEVRSNLDGKPLTYEVLQKMKYLDMVMSETLRKWPAAVGTDRVCVKPYTLVDEESGNKVQINVGDVLSIPVAGIHYMSKYYPNPKKFDPERFNDENKNNINPFTYLPFGAGPRNCIGSRFALMESKAMIFHLLSQFTFEPSKKTKLPLQLSTSGFQLLPKGGFWLQLKPRKNIK